VRFIVVWWLALSLLGWLAWPWLAMLFRRTPGRGYAYARAFGLLILTYIHWLLGVLGIAPNTDAVLCGVSAVLATLSIISWIRNWPELTSSLRREWRHILTVELLFVAVCILYAAYKSYDPAINHTEQPMDFAFLNSMLRSPTMPPNDPWLSGLPISYYYYLGYLTVAVLTRLTGISSGIGYNLGLVHTLGLTTIGCYGLLYSIIRTRGGSRGAGRIARGFAIAGAVAIALASNLAGALELVHALRLGAWLPEGRWWWWRASRVIVDYNLLAKTPTVITEFPIFSFILGDLHPHVMALPYFLLALALAGELLRDRDACSAANWWRKPSYWIMPWVLGALGFLNSWDLPTVLIVAWLAYGIGRWRGPKVRRDWLRDCALFGLWLVVGSVLPYLPFYIGLHSQAQGLGFAYYAKTSLTNYLLCLGIWMLPIMADALDALLRMRRRSSPQVGRRTLLGVWGILLLLPWMLTGLLGGWGKVLLGLVVLLSTGPWLLLLQRALLTVLLVDAARALVDEQPQVGGGWLARILVLVGLGLTYATEFFYLRDVFDTRMNTMFKVYYQAWILLGIGSTAVALRLWQRRGWRRGIVCLSGLLLCVCFYYPVAGAYSKAGGYQGERTLDGTAFLAAESPAEYGAFRWLQAHVQPGDVLVEAPGQEYAAWTNRLSAWTGLPTVLGWKGHEIQWRGTDQEILPRVSDIEIIYTSSNPQEVLVLMEKYGATYLYVGSYERDTYGLGAPELDWYASFLDVCYAEKEIRLYRLPAGERETLPRP